MRKKGEIATNVLSQKQAARYLGISEPTLRRHISEIAHRRLGNRVLIAREALDVWLQGDGAKANR